MGPRGPWPAGRGAGPAALLAALAVAGGVVRIVLTYDVFSQTTDEAAHIAAGMEWLERGRYTFEALHPPLARVAAALGPYLDGRRLGDSGTMLTEGNRILNEGGEYTRTLALARAGILPFFVLASAVVWWWTRRLAGSGAALAAVLLFTTLPPVLAHAGLATTDMAATATLVLALAALWRWEERPTWRRTAALGASAGLAVLAKLSALLFLPVTGTALLLCCRLDPSRPASGVSRGRVLGRLVVALGLAALVVWAGYRFSTGAVTTAATRPHVNVDPLVGAQGWLHDAAYALVEWPWLPAPELLRGVRDIRYANERGRLAYLLGEVRWGGFWHFFPVALAVKTPVPFLLLAGGGAAGFAVLAAGGRGARALAPVAAAAALVAVSLPSRINLGLRHVLAVYPLVAPAAGYALVRLWRSGRPTWRLAGAGLVAWHAAAGLAVHPDYLAYFNELAGPEPHRVLVDSDLDWGQDLLRLERALRERGVTELTLGYLGTADLSRRDLPPYRQLEPDRPVGGWVAISEYWLKAYEDRLTWLTAHEPVTRVGRSIRLYHLPPPRGTGAPSR